MANGVSGNSSRSMRKASASEFGLLAIKRAIIAWIKRCLSSVGGLAGEIEGASCHGNWFSSARCVRPAIDVSLSAIVLPGLS
jgi:hypothetical protein